MYRTITAEFDSPDSAEIAANAIKSKLDGIKNVKIKYEKSTDNNNDGYSSLHLTGNIYPYNNGYVGTQSVSAFPLYNLVNNSYNDYDRHADRYSTIIEISCLNDAVKNVTSMLTSYGGLKIKQ